MTALNQQQINDEQEGQVFQAIHEATVFSIKYPRSHAMSNLASSQYSPPSTVIVTSNKLYPQLLVSKQRSNDCERCKQWESAEFL